MILVISKILFEKEKLKNKENILFKQLDFGLIPKEQESF